MKRKIYVILLLVTLLFSVGCNKEKKNPDPTQAPTATATPTPVPQNPAKVTLKKLPDKFDSLLSYLPQQNVDYSAGIGYDITMELSVGTQIAELLELGSLNSIGAKGTLDIKDTMAANLSFCLNNSPILNSHLFMDSGRMLFNLPDYSANYAEYPLEQLLNVPADAALSSDTTKLNTVIKQHLTDFAECFTEVAGITNHASIGIGDYLLTGDKYTIKANTEELFAVLTSLENELSAFLGTTGSVEEYKPEGSTTFFLDYYQSANGDYAWAAYPDTQADTPLVFINTKLGFCLYCIHEDGTTEEFVYSEKTTNNSGIITISAADEEETDTINYEFSDTSFAMSAMIDGLVFSLDASKVNEAVHYKITVIVDGMSVVLDETIAPERTDISCSMASYGMEYFTLALTALTRDYVEIPMPQNVVSTEVWDAEFNMDALSDDMAQLRYDYPFLRDLFDTSEEPSETPSTDPSEGTTAAKPEGNKDTAPQDFTKLTGYFVDEFGNVDFCPEESEVLALGKPSTGFDAMKLTETQKQAITDYAKKAFKNCNESTFSFYWVWGTIDFDDVKSYYTKDYYFDDAANENNSIILEFDAVSGDFGSVSVFHENKETALQIANDLLALLDVNYTITAELAEDYTIARGFSFSAYDGFQYGDNYYNINFSVYYPEW